MQKGLLATPKYNSLGGIQTRIMGLGLVQSPTSGGPPSFRDVLKLFCNITLTQVVCESPRIVCTDIRFPAGAHFLYPTPHEHSIVFVDLLDNLRDIAQWRVWKSPPAPEPDPIYCIQDCGEKGVGMFARRTIKAGELIISERPIYVARVGLKRASDHTLANGRFERAALAGLSERSRAQIMALRNCHGAESDVVPGILRTNALYVDLTEQPDPSSTFIGCFPTLSRANHSCIPNANYFFSFKAFCGQLFAMRDIPRGAEITIQYTELCASRAERQAELECIFKFRCTCEACSLPAHLLVESDRRRMALGHLVRDLSNRTGERAGTSTFISPKRLSDALGWAQSEHLEVIPSRILLYGSYLLITSRSCNGAEALGWLDRARKAYCMVEGPESYNVRKVVELRAVVLAAMVDRR